MADPHPIVTYSKAAKFDDVRDDLKLAIEGRGLVIDHESFVNRVPVQHGGLRHRAAAADGSRVLQAPLAPRRLGGLESRAISGRAPSRRQA